jgi:hypothetical protein
VFERTDFQRQSPANATIADGQGIGTIVHNEPRISINSGSKAEGKSGTTTMTFTVSLQTVYDQMVTVNCTTPTAPSKPAAITPRTHRNNSRRRQSLAVVYHIATQRGRSYSQDPAVRPSSCAPFTRSR